ncbi:MAG TPA: YHS domain-containing protein [Thermoplasmata archaeon]|nr:YHS domain-containing protein [Thermoplasmata archaeon]
MKAKDPVCGMTIDAEKAAARGVYGSETVYFCSVGCQKSFEAKRRPTGA